MTIQAMHKGLAAGDLGLGGANRAMAPTLNTLTSSPKPPAPRAANGHDTPELREAFDDFVGQTFFGELVKQMRQTVKKPAFFHGGMGEDIFQSQLDQILVERISDASAKTFSDPMYQLFMARRP
jgi:flagellar protein FlgJ